jgi:hypothetical protein
MLLALSFGLNGLLGAYLELCNVSALWKTNTVDKFIPKVRLFFGNSFHHRMLWRDPAFFRNGRKSLQDDFPVFISQLIFACLRKMSARLLLVSVHKLR